MNAKEEELLIYLWTRDANFPVTKETEDYIVTHLQHMKGVKEFIFSDKGRQEMAIRILKRSKVG